MAIATFKNATVDLTEIVSNSAQSRGMGVASNLNQLEIGIFDRIGKGEAFNPVWPALTGGSEEEKQQAIKRLEDHESETINLAKGIAEKGQLQPVGLVKTKDGYDVIFGMRRCLARAYNYATGAGPCNVEAKVYEGKINEVNARLLALEENDNRRDESPIDRAMTYKWLKKEQGLSNKKIAEMTRQSEMNVGNYLALLDPKLEDKRWDIHTRALSVDSAVKLLRARKGGDEGAQPTKAAPSGEQRHRLPGNKKIQKIYEARKKPKAMSPKEWDLWILPDVRKFLAYQLGFKFSEFVPAEEKEESEPVAAKEEKKPKAEATNGKSATKEVKQTILMVKRERAQQLLLCLGKTNARTWDDSKLQDTLGKVSTLVEPGTKVETESLQKLLDRLLVAGTTVKIKES